MINCASLCVLLAVTFAFESARPSENSKEVAKLHEQIEKLQEEVRILEAEIGVRKSQFALYQGSWFAMKDAYEEAKGIERWIAVDEEDAEKEAQKMSHRENKRVDRYVREMIDGMKRMRSKLGDKELLKVAEDRFSWDRRRIDSQVDTFLRQQKNFIWRAQKKAAQ